MSSSLMAAAPCSFWTAAFLFILFTPSFEGSLGPPLSWLRVTLKSFNKRTASTYPFRTRADFRAQVYSSVLMSGINFDVMREASRRRPIE
jgi:hypothetical protein